MVIKMNEDKVSINWYPGHMAKAKRLISSALSEIDIVVELLDARIPLASKNPDIESLIQHKTRLLILNKADLADPQQTKKWIEYYNSNSYNAISLNSLRFNEKIFYDAIYEISKEKRERDLKRGIKKPSTRIMILGIPNVGKSTLINSLSHSRKVKTEDRPGVTRGKQWVSLNNGILLLDMPGILWPKLDNQKAALNLAYTGAIKHNVLNIEEVAERFIGHIKKDYSKELGERYKLESLPNDDREVLLSIGKKRGYIISGGEIDIERTAIVILDEFRSGKIGRITLDSIAIMGDINDKKV